MKIEFEISFKQTRTWLQKRRRPVLITVAVLVVLAAAGTIFKNVMANRSSDLTLAIVNGQRLRVSDFKKQMAAVPDFYQAYVAGNRSQFLQDLIDRELIYQKARHSRYSGSRDIRDRLAELKKDFLVQVYVQKEILENPKIPEKEMRDYFKSHPMDFIQPASVHLYEIMVPDRKTAETVIERYRKGDSFEDLARQYSQAPSKGKGGDLGFVREGTLPAELDRVAFGLSPDQVSQPISTGAGIYVLMARQTIPSRQLSYDEAVPLLKKIMTSKYGEKNFQDFLVNLRSRARIKILEGNLDKMAF